MRSKSTRAVKSLKKSVAAHKSVFAHSTAVSLCPPNKSLTYRVFVLVSANWYSVFDFQI